MPCRRSSICWSMNPGVRASGRGGCSANIHPYPNGNGRMARFVMTAVLASGGYPWTVIRVEDRNLYLAALDRASIDMKIAKAIDEAIAVAKVPTDEEDDDEDEWGK
jgi:fido (protein-threonine AMPylation protein)